MSSTSDGLAREDHPARENTPGVLQRIGDLLTGATSSTALTKEEAFFTILLGAVWVDGEVAAEESQEVAALAGRTKTLCRETAARIATWQTAITQKIINDGLQSVVKAACDRLLTIKENPEIVRARAESLFAHAVELVLADRRVRQAERGYIDLLATNLNIAPDRAKLLIEVIQAKNAF